MIKDPTRTGQVAAALVWIWLAVEAAKTLAALLIVQVLGGFDGVIRPMPELQRADQFTRLTSIAYLLVILAVGIAVLRWIYLTNRNAHGLSDMVVITPGWAVGWFFVPFASLFKPFQAMRETWLASARADDPDGIDIPAVMRWWWGAWIVTSVLANVQWRLSMGTRTPETVIFSSWFTIASFPIDDVLAIALTQLIARLSRLQRDRIADEYAMLFA